MIKKLLAGLLLMASACLGQTVHTATLENPNTFASTNVFSNPVQFGPLTVAGLTSLPNGNFVYVSDGTPGSVPCTGGGTGTFAERINGAWTCVGIGGGVSSLTAGNGLTGGTITSTGTIAVDATRVPFLVNNNTYTGTNTFNAAATFGNTATFNGTSVTVSASTVFNASGGGTLSGAWTAGGNWTFSNFPTLTPATQGLALGVGSGSVFYSRPNEIYGADFVGSSPTLLSLLAKCPVYTGTVPCRVFLNAGMGTVNVGSQTGTVNTSGTTVTWVSGNQFCTCWIGSDINIANVVYTITNVSSTTSLTLATTAGTQTGSTFNYSVVIGSDTQAVTVVNYGAQLNCATGFGIDCLQLAKWGNYIGDVPGNALGSGSIISSSSGQNFERLLSNSRKDGLQTQMYASGISFNAACSSNTYSRGIMGIVAVEGKGRFDNMTWGGCANTTDLVIEDGGAGTTIADNNNLTFHNVAMYCSGDTNCMPLLIVGGAGTGSGDSIYFDGWNGADAGIQNGASNPCPATVSGAHSALICIDGSAAWNGTSYATNSSSHFLTAVYFTSTYLEGCTAMGSCTTDPNFIAAKNVKSLFMPNVTLNVGPTLADCIHLDHSAFPGLGYVYIFGRELGVHCTNVIHNVVTGYTSGNISDFSYIFPGEQSTPTGTIFDGPVTVAALNQTVANSFAGSCSMSSGTTCTFTLATAAPTTYLCNAFLDHASAPPASAIQVKCAVAGNTVTITAGASNSLTWDAVFIGNPN